jgi:hypothetical protein
MSVGGRSSHSISGPLVDLGPQVVECFALPLEQAPSRSNQHLAESRRLDDHRAESLRKSHDRGSAANTEQVRRKVKSQGRSP